MIEPIDDLPAGVIGLRVVGELATNEYQTVIVPAFERLSVSHRQLRLLLYLGPEFTGFGPGAWGELTQEIRRTHFHRGAVVTDDDTVRHGLNLLKWLLKGHVRTFRNREYDAAVVWVSR